MGEVEIEKLFSDWGQNTYPSKIKLMKRLIDNNPSKSISFLFTVHEKTFQMLDVREAILEADKFFSINAENKKEA